MAAAKEAARSYFEETCLLLFDAHPVLTEFGWTQYTLYFCDGDPRAHLGLMRSLV